MTYVSIDFDDHEPYADNRPRGKVVLQGPGGYHGSTWTSYALVDTGCDFLHLPEEAAYVVGINLSNATKVRVITAGGEIYMVREMVDVEIQGEQVNVPCNFGQEAKPLIGMQAIFQVVKTSGFTSSEWLLDRY